mmetsp:Transcript_512/g.1102  ORF Transcript_512/g.1102 Transcript_512/m.1102 type:complete len:212 (+) Transcript_512:1579-2214(+)
MLRWRLLQPPLLRPPRRHRLLDTVRGPREVGAELRVRRAAVRARALAPQHLAMRRQGQPASLRSRLVLLPDSADARPDCGHHALGSCVGPQPQPLWRHRAIPALSGVRGPPRRGPHLSRSSGQPARLRRLRRHRPHRPQALALGPPQAWQPLQWWPVQRPSVHGPPRAEWIAMSSACACRSRTSLTRLTLATQMRRWSDTRRWRLSMVELQ